MLIYVGIGIALVGLVWWLSGVSFSDTQKTSNTQIDEHAMIKKLIAQTQNEKAKSFLREAGKAFYDE